MEHRRKYWFKPARFWKQFAAYYPSSPEGWVVTLLLVIVLVVIFRVVDAGAHSVSDTLTGVVPWEVSILLTFDVFCFRKGQYPEWWRRS